MAIREDLVASAVSLIPMRHRCSDSRLLTDCAGPMYVGQVPSLHPICLADPVTVLQDPNVASSSVENRVGFLRSKNLTQEEIDHALSRTGAVASPSVGAPYSPQGAPQPYYPPYQQQAWQPQPPPRRDWRDWFIMATLVSGVSYGVYALGKVSSRDAPVCEIPMHQLTSK